MITNEKIWKAVDRVAREHGLTGGGLARYNRGFRMRPRSDRSLPKSGDPA